MQLQVGDRLTDETGEWKVIGRPYTTKRREGRARPRWDGSQPDVTEIRMWARTSASRANAHDPSC
jgi:hypothetical protein